MRRSLTKNEAWATLRATPEKRREIDHLAIDLDKTMIELTDEVLAIGLRGIKARLKRQDDKSQAEAN